MRRPWLVLALLMLFAAKAWSADSDSGVRVAILGDSLSTGAATHPDLTFDSVRLWELFSGARSTLARAEDLPKPIRDLVGPDERDGRDLLLPRRLWPTSREFFGGPDWLWRHIMQAVARQYLDTGAYSWGAMTGRLLGIPPAAVALAGEDGARVAQLPRHLDRVLAASGGLLPPIVLIMYTGNDLCGANLAQTTTSDEFASDLDRGLAYLVRNGRPAAATGTDVYLLSYLSVLQLATSEAILNKSVAAFGGQSTCRELRQRAFRPPGDQLAAEDERAVRAGVPWYLRLALPPNPAVICSTLFDDYSAGGVAREKSLSALANRIRDFREAESRAVERYGTLGRDAAGGGIRVHLISSTAKLVFGAEDIAGDCFHLSPVGQAKVAQAVAADVLERSRSSH